MSRSTALKVSFLGPGIGFGPFHVNDEQGKRGDFNLFELFNLGATASAVERMAGKGVVLPPSQELVTKVGQLRSRGFREFEIHCNVTAGPSLGLEAAERCPACGEFLEDERLRVPDPVILKKSIPKKEDLYRWAEYDSVLLASERFANAFHDLGLGGLEFREVGLE